MCSVLIVTTPEITYNDDAELSELHATVLLVSNCLANEYISIEFEVIRIVRTWIILLVAIIIPETK